jgi:ribosomal protein S18 acetylase RimI-like enzyme
VKYFEQEYSYMNKFQSITLRAANQSDMTFLVELRRLSMARVVTNHRPWIEAAQKERVLLHFESARIICSGDRDIGLLKVVYDPNLVHLCQIQLLPEFQGKGIGTMLITKLQDEVASSGVPISLNVFRSNPALHLYARMGFCICAEDADSYTLVWHPSGTSSHGDDTDTIHRQPEFAEPLNFGAYRLDQRGHQDKVHLKTRSRSLQTWK